MVTACQFLHMYGVASWGQAVYGCECSPVVCGIVYQGLGPVLQPRGPIAPDGWRVLQCAEEGTRDAIQAAGIAALERSLKRAEADNDEVQLPHLPPCLYHLSHVCCFCCSQELVQRLRIQVKAARLAHRQAQLRAQLLLEHLKGTGRLTEAQATAATTLARVSQGRRSVGPHGPAFDGLGAGAGAGAVPGASSWTAQVLAQEVLAIEGCECVQVVAYSLRAFQVDGLAMASDGIARRHRVEPPPRSADAFEREVARRKHERDTRRRQERQVCVCVWCVIDCVLARPDSHCIVVAQTDVLESHSSTWSRVLWLPSKHTTGCTACRKGSCHHHHQHLVGHTSHSYPLPHPLLQAVKAHLETLIREREREADREERARIRALKANDMDKYLELVQTAKNDRIQFLLNQTDAALRDIGALVSKHQDEQVGGDSHCCYRHCIVS